MIQSNPNFKMVQDSTKSKFYMNLLQNTAKVTYNENVPRDNLQKTS